MASETRRPNDRDKMRAMVVRAIVLFLVTFGLALAVFALAKHWGFDFGHSWHDGRIGAAAIAAVVVVVDAIAIRTRRLPTSR
jgi:hypothetical protein